MDPKLNWKEHIKQSATRGTAAFEALARLATSTWDPSMRRARLIYSAAVRPAMMYGAQVWSVRKTGEAAKIGNMQSLKVVQNKCLRKITGGYKRTPSAALEREAGIPPLDLYTEATALQRAASTANHPVYTDISNTLDAVWAQMKGGRRGSRRRNTPPRPPSGLERARQRATERIQEMQTRRNNFEVSTPGKHKQRPI